MAKCTRCGTSVGVFVKLCNRCKQEIEAERVRQLNEQRGRNEAELAQAEKRRQEQIREMIAKQKTMIRKQLESGQKVFLYHSLYVPVDSVLLENNLADYFDISVVRNLGLSGWEVIQAVPRTVGVGLENYSAGGITSKSWGGGVGGNILGTHLILKKELNLTGIENDAEDELGSYLETHIFKDANA
jgi:hypothetical protein